ncbi:MAG: sigma-70 family RNA polymerase sigma factor [Duncaniella sp.]|nr:sigma-70 family RNA polymerase sigma factor [Duncaniella sp.]
MQYTTAEFETLYKHHFPPSMRLAMSLLHDEDEARDVVQEVFLKLWETDYSVENPAGFILRAVRNTCLTHLNRLDTREKILRRLALDEPPDDYDIQLRNEEITMAVKILLTPKERVTVEKIYSDRMTYRETAESLGVSVAAVNKNVVSALKKLRNHFKTGKS